MGKKEEVEETNNARDGRKQNVWGKRIGMASPPGKPVGRGTKLGRPTVGQHSSGPIGFVNT